MLVKPAQVWCGLFVLGGRMDLPHDPPAKLERAIIALWRAWEIQGQLGKARDLEAKKRLDPIWHVAWEELGASLDDLALWRRLHGRDG